MAASPKPALSGKYYTFPAPEAANSLGFAQYRALCRLPNLHHINA
jgi:hypothetical protein